jgi:SAM-dependent methyltransferase
MTEAKWDLKKYWNDRAATYYVPDVTGRRAMKSFIDKLRPQPKSFIEVGCGAGFLMKMYQHFPRAVAIDYSEEMLKRSARRIQRHNYNIELFLLDVTEGHLEEKFDVLITRTVLMHIHPDDIEAACRNVSEMSDHLLIFEYWEERDPGNLAPHNWLHDYYGLFEELGYEVVEAYKRPDLRQVLFNFKR